MYHNNNKTAGAEDLMLKRPKEMPKLETHNIARFFYERTGADGIVIQTANPLSLIGQYDEGTPLFIVSSSLKSSLHRRALAKKLANAIWLSKKDLNDDFLKNKILVNINPAGSRLRRSVVHKETSQISSKALISIVTVQEKQANRLVSSALDSQTVITGKVRLFENSSVKNQVAIVGGQLIDIHKGKYPLIKVLAVIPQYNEKDIISSTIDHLLKQGTDIHIIDNWSDDGSYELVQSIAERFPKRITYERFPDKKTNEYNWTEILKRVTAVAYEMRKQYDWVTLNDADEMRWSPWKDVTLQKAFSFLDSLGYNCIDYTVFNFKPTEDGFTENDDASSFFKYGEFGAIEGYFVQVKSWKNSKKADLASSGGHHVLFPGLRVFPLKFLLCHYPLRSTKQATQKIFRDRNPRFPEKEKNKGWHKHYLGITESESFIYNKDDLVRFSQSRFSDDYIYERISGIGIKRQ